jgi:outer membrane protein assembly factor BamB
VTYRAATIVVIGISIGLAACGSAMQSDGYRGAGESVRPDVKSNILTVRWTTPLAPDFPGRFIPVEYASGTFDPGTGQLLIGSSTGYLWAFSLDGRQLFRYSAGSAIEAAPALDPNTGRIFIGTAGGTIDVIDSNTAKRVWRTSLEGPIRRQPLLASDAAYVVTAANSLVAMSRTNGELLWRYRRDIPESFSIAGNAGILSAYGKIFTGFSDGMVVALDPSDGRVVWERNTSLDVENNGDQSPLFDVDTTPVQVGDEIYVASFSGGLYALMPSSGAVIWRNPDLKAITSIAASGNRIIVSSAENGVICMDPRTHAIIWRHQVQRGAPSEPTVADGLVFVGESEGGFLALSSTTGQERARIESGHGFSAAASVRDGRGFLMSNGGTLFAFSY